MKYFLNQRLVQTMPRRDWLWNNIGEEDTVKFILRWV